MTTISGFSRGRGGTSDRESREARVTERLRLVCRREMSDVQSARIFLKSARYSMASMLSFGFRVKD